MAGSIGTNANSASVEVEVEVEVEAELGNFGLSILKYVGSVWFGSNLVLQMLFYALRVWP